ncbi:hypothetical protein B5M09_003749 [Aphanomyces astaci]|uniref:RING-type domain-containing protein n=1 Tax=Aphanomyces astaci TaxID=112090 RepID=A0A3R7ZB02_APHAT|nr:hypothetical protein B5M09_003749 [Aphanomyces astaci]
MDANARRASLDRNGWVEVMDEHGVVMYRHLQSGHCQSHLPVVGAPSEYKSLDCSKSRRSLAHRSSSASSADDEKALQVRILRNVSKSMISDYMTEVDKFNMAKPYARRPDGTYEDAACVVCKQQPTHMVLFPCQHKCVCDACIQSLGEVKVMFECTGREVDEYWDWVYDVKPHLSRAFEVKFKSTALKLAKPLGTGAVVVPTNDKHGSLHRRISNLLLGRSVDVGHADGPSDRRTSCMLM